MAISQERSRRKVTGSRYVDYRKKKLHSLGRDPTFTRIGKPVVRSLRARSKIKKEVQITNDILNLYDPKTKKYSKVKIKSVIDNPANKNYIRRSILTKGTIVETEKGKARITSRPGQEGSLNGVAISEK